LGPEIIFLTSANALLQNEHRSSLIASPPSISGRLGTNLCRAQLSAWNGQVPIGSANVIQNLLMSRMVNSRIP
jgi:hypothetical protein